MIHDDHYDGCSDIGMFDPAKVTIDSNVDALVLFADVDFEDQKAVAKRKAEWEALDGV